MPTRHGKRPRSHAGRRRSSAFLTASGEALGTLSTVAIAPLPASNGVGDIGSELAYARGNGHPNLQLVNGTEPFKPKLLGLIG